MLQRHFAFPLCMCVCALIIILSHRLCLLLLCFSIFLFVFWGCSAPFSLSISTRDFPSFLDFMFVFPRNFFVFNSLKVKCLKIWICMKAKATFLSLHTLCTPWCAGIKRHTHWHIYTKNLRAKQRSIRKCGCGREFYLKHSSVCTSYLLSPFIFTHHCRACLLCPFFLSFYYC